MNRFETVRPADLAVGDVVQGNGALWRILAFEQTRLGQTEMVKVSCVDPQGVRPFEVGFEKQFIRQPRGGTWDRLAEDLGDDPLGDWHGRNA